MPGFTLWASRQITLIKPQRYWTNKKSLLRHISSHNDRVGIVAGGLCWREGERKGEVRQTSPCNIHFLFMLFVLKSQAHAHCTTSVRTEISPQRLDGLPWNLMQICVDHHLVKILIFPILWLMIKCLQTSGIAIRLSCTSHLVLISKH